MRVHSNIKERNSKKFHFFSVYIAHFDEPELQIVKMHKTHFLPNISLVWDFEQSRFDIKEVRTLNNIGLKNELRYAYCTSQEIIVNNPEVFLYYDSFIPLMFH